MEDYSKYSYDDLINCFQAVYDYLVLGIEPDEEMFDLLDRGEYASYAAKRDQEKDSGRKDSDKEDSDHQE